MLEMGLLDWLRHTFANPLDPSHMEPCRHCHRWTLKCNDLCGECGHAKTERPPPGKLLLPPAGWRRLTSAESAMLDRDEARMFAELDEKRRNEPVEWWVQAQ